MIIFGKPKPSRPGDKSEEGVSGAHARADHRHGREDEPEAFELTYGPPTDSAPGDVADEGTEDAVARADHRHGREDAEDSGGIFDELFSHDDPGLALTKLGIVLTASAGTWDGTLVESPCVFRDPKSGRWTMLYVGYGTTTGATRAQIGLAYSNDGYGWAKEATPTLSHSAISGAPDENGCTGPFCVYENGTYHLIYIGLTSTGIEAGTKSLCYATATSLAGPWLRQGAIISPSGSGWRASAIYHPHVVKRLDTYYLFFNAADNSGVESIGFATADAIQGPWTVHDAESPLLGPTSGWEAQQLGDPSVRRLGKYWIMDYYGAASGFTQASDGIAVTPDEDFPLGWIRCPYNPILIPSESYDNKYAHKPGIVVSGGQVRHYYTAVDMSDVRQIALAVTTPLGLTATKPGPVVSDPFTRANSSSLGATDTGQAWATDGVTGWGIDTDRMAWTGASDSFAYVDSGLADNYYVEFVADTITGTYPLAVVGRYVSTSSYVKIFRQQVANVWQMSVSGSVTSGSAGTPDINNGDVIRLEVTGTNYKLKVNGTLIDTFTTSALNTVTQQGVGGSGGIALYVDTFKVDRLT